MLVGNDMENTTPFTEGGGEAAHGASRVFSVTDFRNLDRPLQDLSEMPARARLIEDFANASSESLDETLCVADELCGYLDDAVMGNGLKVIDFRGLVYNKEEIDVPSKPANSSSTIIDQFLFFGYEHEDTVEAAGRDGELVERLFFSRVRVRLASFQLPLSDVSYVAFERTGGMQLYGRFFENICYELSDEGELQISFATVKAHLATAKRFAVVDPDQFNPESPAAILLQMHELPRKLSECVEPRVYLEEEE